MKFTPKPKQNFLVLSMLFGTTPEEQEPMQSETGVEKKLRDELVRAGLVRLEKRRQGRSNAMHLVLEDTAWDFLANHLGGELPKTQRAAKLLETVLGRLQTFLHDHDHSLAEFVSGASEASESVDSVAQPKELREHTSEAEIRDACLALTQGETRKRVRLKDLRATVPVGRDALDRTLLAMQTAGRLVLYKMDNPAEISPEDERAALFIAGQPRHLVYLEA